MVKFNPGDTFMTSFGDKATILYHSHTEDQGAWPVYLVRIDDELGSYTVFRTEHHIENEIAEQRHQKIRLIIAFISLYIILLTAIGLLWLM